MTRKTPEYVLLRVDFYSPYTSVQFFAEHGRGVPVPPPSTLLGALAAVLYHPTEREVGEEVVEAVRYASFYVPHYQSVENISRHFTWLSQKKQRIKALKAATRLVEGASINEVYKDLKNYANIKSSLEELRKHSPIEVARIAVQVLLMPATRLETYFAESGYLLYVIDDPKVAESARMIYRLGPKESLIAVTPLEVENVQRIRDGAIKTRFYFPRDAARNVINCIETYMFDRPVENPLFSTPRKYCLPNPIEDMLVEPVDGWVPVQIIADGLELSAMVPEHAAP
ncbi:MAG: CRISPR-associated protein Cas5 [Thermoproteus sp.]